MEWREIHWHGDAGSGGGAMLITDAYFLARKGILGALMRLDQR